MAGQRLGSNARRVIIKSRFVVLHRASPNSVSVHLRYIERDGVTRDGQKGQAYGADTEAADVKAFQERGQNDRHQFRFIVSPEDGLELEDLKGFTRQLMRRVEIDLETRLDWVAVDHWDTDKPHTHIVLNGRAAGNVNLVIAPNYMAHGMRMRACEIATEWLGPRTDVEMHQSLLREVAQQRLTSLDRTLIRHADREGIDLTGKPQDYQRQIVLRARLQRLEGMGLAERIDAHRWMLKPGLAVTLDTLGARQDALDVMRKALKAEQRELVLERHDQQSVTGRIAGKGLADELHDCGYLVVDGIDGRAHYVNLPADTDLGGFPLGAIVEARAAGRQRAVDCNILAASKHGIYTTTGHAAQLAQTGKRDPQATLEVHVRRLESLRRDGIVERIEDGVWKLPADLLRQTQHQDVQKAHGLTLELRSHLPVEQQVRAMGASWLDRQLLDEGKALAPQGFGTKAREAMERRADFLVEQGLAERSGPRIVLTRNLLATLRDRELVSAGKALEAQSGRRCRSLMDGQQATGVYRGSIQLISGRFAMLDDGTGLSLVPWKPMVQQRLGQRLTASMRGSSVTWNFGRQHGIGD